MNKNDTYEETAGSAVKASLDLLGSIVVIQVISEILVVRPILGSTPRNVSGHYSEECEHIAGNNMPLYY